MAGIVITAARELIDLIRSNRPTGPEGLAALAEALDRLAVAVHDAPEGDAGLERAPPLHAMAELRRAASDRFPELGPYAWARPLPDELAESQVRDAAADLAIILGAALSLAWRWDNIGPDNAHWWFRAGYEAGWGRELFALRGALHAMLCDEEEDD